MKQDGHNFHPFCNVCVSVEQSLFMKELYWNLEFITKLKYFVSHLFLFFVFYLLRVRGNLLSR